MADSNIFKIIVEGVDKFSAPIEAMHKKVVAFAAPVQQLGERLQHLGSLAGVDKVSASFRTLASRISEAHHALLGFVSPLAVLGTLGSLGGLFEAVEKTAAKGAQLHDAAQAIGLTAEQLQRLRYAAGQAGVAPETLDTAMEKLNRTLGDAAAGKNKEAAQLFGRMGIDMKAVRSGALNAAGVMPRLADLIKANANETMRARIETLAFGRAGQGLNAMLVGGAGAIAEWTRQADAAGVMTNAQVEAAKAFQQSYDRLKSSIEGVVNAVAVKAMPAFKQLVDHISDWIQKHRELIATKSEQFITGLSEALKKMPWKDIERGVERALQLFRDMTGSTGRLKALMWGIVGVASGPLIAAFTNIGGALIGIARAAAPLALTGFGLLIEGAAALSFKVGLAFDALAGLASGVPVVGAVLEGLSGAFLAIGAAIEATPIGWIITGVVLLGAAAYELYENWTAIGKWWHSWWDEAADAVKTAVGAMIDTFFPVLGMMLRFGGLLGADDKVSAGVKSGIAGLKKHLEGLNLDAMPLLMPPPALAAPMRRFQDFPSYGAPYGGGYEPGRGGYGQTLGKIEVSFADMPRGVRVKTQETGALSLLTNLGYSMRESI